MTEKLDSCPACNRLLDQWEYDGQYCSCGWEYGTVSVPSSSSPLGILLIRVGWTSAELAHRLRISPDTVSQWLRRRTPPPMILIWLEQVAAGVDGAGPAPADWNGLRRGPRPRSA
jgi:hypothetical protein